MEFRWYTRRDPGAEDAYKIRKIVFCDEVGFTEDFEFDETDKISCHLVLYLDGIPTGAARINREEGNTWHFGRLCCLVPHRGKGLGKALLNEAVRKCLLFGADKINLGAKYDKRDFYRSRGFSPTEEIFYEEGIPHINMTRNFDISPVTRDSFDIPQHANLFALIYRRSAELAGSAGREAADKGTQLYGRQRGRRMAERARRDGAPLNMESYLLYGEWEDKNYRSQSEEAPTSPRYTTLVSKCGWCEAWKESGLLEYGKNYCTYVDKSLVRGFNSRLRLDIQSILSQGGDRCCFVWNGFSLDSDSQKADYVRKSKGMSPKKIKDFLYHTGHLLRAMTSRIGRELGEEKAGAIKEKALRDFEGMYGQEQTAAVIVEARQDFTLVDY